MAGNYETLDENDEELFQKYSKNIDQNVRKTFPWIIADFQLKPVTIRKGIMCGVMCYELKIALSDGQFAKVIFFISGDLSPITPDENPPELDFDVDPTSSASQYE